MPDSQAEEKRYVFKSGGFYGDMVQWLEEDLKKVNRTERPWLFVSGHHPMYAEGAANLDMQAALEGLFHQCECSKFIFHRGISQDYQSSNQSIHQRATRNACNYKLLLTKLTGHCISLLGCLSLDACISLDYRSINQ